MKKSNSKRQIKAESKKVELCPSLLVPGDSSLRFNITNQDWRNGFIHKFETWASDPDHVDVTQFLKEERIPRKTFYVWCRDYPDLGEVWEEVKLWFASHRRVGSIFRRMDGRWAHRGIEFFDEEEMKITIFEAEVAKASQSEPVSFNINMGKPEVQGKERVKEIVDATV